MYRIFFLLAFVATRPAFADQIDDGQVAVKLHLIKADRWTAVSCQSASIENQEFVYCHAAGSSSGGGLYAISINNKKPEVHPVNGKAKQYMSVDEIEAMDGSSIAVRPWTGDPTSISRIIIKITE